MINEDPVTCSRKCPFLKTMGIEACTAYKDIDAENLSESYCYRQAQIGRPCIYRLSVEKRQELYNKRKPQKRNLENPDLIVENPESTLLLSKLVAHEGQRVGVKVGGRNGAYAVAVIFVQKEKGRPVSARLDFLPGQNFDLLPASKGDYLYFHPLPGEALDAKEPKSEPILRSDEGSKDPFLMRPISKIVYSPY